MTTLFESARVKILPNSEGSGESASLRVCAVSRNLRFEETKGSLIRNSLANSVIH